MIAAQVNRRFQKQFDRLISPGMATFMAIVLGLILFYLLKIPQALDTIMKSGDFFVVTFRTILYVMCCIPLFFIVGLVLALLLNVPDLPGRTFFRVALIVPWAASTVAIMMSLVWKFFFQEKGTINQVLGTMGIPGQVWLNNPTIAFLVIVLANVWYSYPFFMVTILGALQSIPAEVYEAAEVDGATYLQKLFNITLPLLRVAVIPVIVLSSITTFQMFGTVWAITAGGPSRGAGTPGATELVMVYAYKQVFQTQAYGRMGAFALIMFVLLFGATLYSLRISRITQGASS
jgi:arabinogalactan oligomer/maltooligosaccharide transport system permease protein